MRSDGPQPAARPYLRNHIKKGSERQTRPARAVCPIFLVDGQKSRRPGVSHLCFLWVEGLPPTRNEEYDLIQSMGFSERYVGGPSRTYLAAKP